MKLTSDQLTILKGLVEYAEAFCDQVLHIMKNHGLDKIDGCNLSVSVDPSCLFTTEVVRFGLNGKDSGFISLAKGRRMDNELFSPFGLNSPEYELLFASDEVKEALRKALIANKEKPLPVDGLWVGRDFEEE